MKGFTRNFKLIGLATLLLIGMVGCGREEGPAEKAGRHIDDATEKAIKKLNEATDQALEQLDELSGKLDRELGDATEILNEQGKKVGEIIDDATITSKVKAAIFAEPSLKSLQINVDTLKGVVTLNGVVDSRASSDLAQQIAGAVAGVKGVRNRLVIKTREAERTGGTAI